MKKILQYKITQKILLTFRILKTKLEALLAKYSPIGGDIQEKAV